MNWTEFLTKEIETVFAATLALLNKVDSGRLDWKPATGSNWMTVGQLLKHITEGCGMGCKAFLTGEWGLPPGVKWEDLTPEQMMPPAEQLPSIGSVEQARDLLAKDKQLALDVIGEAGEDALANRLVAAPWSPGSPVALGFQMHKMIQHLGQHKSQLFYYLKLQGQPVNTQDLYGEF
jgi:hypothetical protein